jgi:uncharacterized membrane protein YuzA (DUF378 family)
MLEGDGMFIFLIVLTGLCAVFMIVPAFIKASENTVDAESEKKENDGSDSNP